MKNTANKNGSPTKRAGKAAANSGNDSSVGSAKKPAPKVSVVHAQPSLLDTPSSVAPISGDWLTPAQFASLLPFAAIDDSLLRRLSNPNNPNPRTGAPWIPRPQVGRWLHDPTIHGLCEWFHHTTDTDGLPDVYDSMIDLENSPLRIPRAFTKWALANGASAAKLTGSRINRHPIQQKAAAILSAIPTGRVTGIEGLEEVDKDTEIGLKVRVEREDLLDAQKIRRGELLLTRDGTAAMRELVVDEILWEKFLQPLRSQIVKLPANLNRQIKTILGSGGKATPEDAAKLKRLDAAITTAIADLLKRFHQKIPARQAEPTLEKEAA